MKQNAGFSVAAGTFHSAKWCWSLLNRSIESSKVELFSRTKMLGIDDAGEHYVIRTKPGRITPRNVVLFTESYTLLLKPLFHNIIHPTKTQAATGFGGPFQMKPNVGILNSYGFSGKPGNQTMVGSDVTRVPDHETGRIQPSCLITHYLCSEMQKVFGRANYTITNEWSGTVTYTQDEYPIVGTIDGKRLYILSSMAGVGIAVSFNGGYCIVNRILGETSESDDYPEQYFSHKRLIDPKNHIWP